VTQWYSSFLYNSGYLRAGLRLAEDAYRLDPLSPVVVTRLADARLHNGDIAAALELAQQAARMGNRGAYRVLDENYTTQGRMQDAAQAMTHWGGLPPERAPLIQRGRELMFQPGRRGEALDAIARAWAPLPMSETRQHQALADRALAFGYADIATNAVRWLRQNGSPNYFHAEITIGANKMWVPLALQNGLYQHPRIQELLAVEGLPELWDVAGPPDRCRKISGQWKCE
jgi:hypothetical protein